MITVSAKTPETLLKSCPTLTAADSPSCETATILISPRLGLKKRHYPLLADLDIENLMKVREEDKKAFVNFKFAVDHLYKKSHLPNYLVDRVLLLWSAPELLEIMRHDQT
jgi:hypothetical protein